MDPLDEFEQCWSGLGQGLGGLDYNTNEYRTQYFNRPLHGSLSQENSQFVVRMSGSESSFHPIEFLVKKKMPTCCVVDCENRTSSAVKFFRIPAGSHPFKKKNRRHLWLQAIKRADWDNATIKEARV